MKVGVAYLAGDSVANSSNVKQEGYQPLPQFYVTETLSIYFVISQYRMFFVVFEMDLLSANIHVLCCL